MRDIRVFLFHRVSEHREKWAHATPVSVFEKCLRYISKNFTVKTVEECLAMQGKDMLNHAKPLACINFDDGFKDNIEYALPVLEKYKCPASFYVATQCIDDGLPTWPHRFQNIFLNTEKMQLDISAEFLSKPIHEKFASQRHRIEYGDKLLKRLMTMPNENAYKLLNEIGLNFDDVPKPANMMMNWNEVRQLSSAGYPIGSHTCSHPMLTQLETDEKVKYELAHSAERIEKECGIFPEAIAYTLGITDTRIMNIATECGYKYGLTVNQRFYHPLTDSTMAVPRVDLFADSGWIKTYLRLTGDMEKIKKVLGK